MGKIKKLPQSVVSKIAAGEVVENPAAIVKELVENSIDAGADQIEVSILNGGIDYIKVSDNGSGITKEDLVAALELHATSKISEIEDLEELISHGFRGEALASIAAVSDLEIISATSNSEAYRITSDTPEISSRSQGTTVIAENLFRKVPARRKFLKSIASEEKKVRGFMKAISLAYPKVAFKYINNEKEIFHLQSQGLLQRYTQIYPKLDSKELIPLEAELNSNSNDDGQNSNNSKFSLTGIFATANYAQKRPEQIISVNNRIINSPLIASAVKRAYGTTIPSDLKPQFFLNISIPSSIVDVNVHPRKEEVKFSDESLIFKTVLNSVSPIITEHVQAEFKSRFTPQQHIQPEFRSEAPIRTSNYKPSNDSFFDLASVSREPKRELKSEQHNAPQPYQRLDYAAPEGFFGDYLQLFYTYILIEKDDKFLMIDQHAADERVKYEMYMKQFNQNNIQRSPLLLPIIIETEIEDEQMLGQFITQINDLGFKVEPFGENEQGKHIIKTSEIPLLLTSRGDYSELITESLIEFEREGLELNELSKALDRVIATFACHGSIRAGEKLSREKINKLITDLFNCEKPYSCPHGRPIIWEIPRTEIEKNFKRIK